MESSRLLKFPRGALRNRIFIAADFDPRQSKPGPVHGSAHPVDCFRIQRVSFQTWVCYPLGRNDIRAIEKW